jgi:hypothetical protein
VTDAGGSRPQRPQFVIGTVLRRTFKVSFSGAVIGSRVFGLSLLLGLAYAALIALLSRQFEWQTNAIFLHLASLPYAFIFAPMAVSLHRLVLLNEALPVSPLSAPRTAKYALCGLILSAPLVALSFLMQVHLNAGQTGPILVLSPHTLLALSYLPQLDLVSGNTGPVLTLSPVTVVVSLLSLRFFVALPYLVLGEVHPVRAAWRYTKGHWLKVTALAAVLGATLTAMILIGTILMLLFHVMLMLLPDTPPGVDATLPDVAFELFLAAVTAFFVVLTAVLLSQIVLAVDPRAPRPAGS